MFFRSYSYSMMEKLKTMVSLIIIIICLPYLVTFVVQGDFLNHSQQEKTSQQLFDENLEQLILTVAKEMPADYEKEALKAQTVIARTNIAYALENEQAEPEFISREDLRSQLGAEKFRKYYELLKNCAEETDGEIITYKEKAVQLPYHFVSAGKTRDVSEVDEDHTMPYLKSVSSVSDLRSEHFLEIEFLSMEQFRNRLVFAFSEIEFPKEDEAKMISIEKRDSASYVLTASVPGKKVTGEEIRSALKLNSTCFSIKKVDDKIRIVIKGYGQGYGMSQYGANVMAEEGKNYKEILEYYYSDITIKRYEGSSMDS